jgi:hypothetical protein
MPKVNIRTIYGELKRIERTMATRAQIESFINTVEILNNPNTMEQLIESAKDIKAGKVKEINSVKDILKEG